MATLPYGQAATVPVQIPPTDAHISPAGHEPHGEVTSASGSHCHDGLPPHVSDTTPEQRSCPPTLSTQHRFVTEVSVPPPSSVSVDTIVVGPHANTSKVGVNQRYVFISRDRSTRARRPLRGAA